MKIRFAQFTLFLAFCGYLQGSQAAVIDSTNVITKINAAAHLDHPDPLKKLGDPTLIFTEQSPPQEHYGVFTPSSTIYTNDDGKNANILQGLAANPLTDSSNNYQYSGMAVVQGTVDIQPVVNS